MHACSSLRYVDADADCSGWASNGECEANPQFMFERCNQSCVTLALPLHTFPCTSRLTFVRGDVAGV